jgi:hypothetical protein
MYNIFNMKNNQKGSVGVIILVIAVIVLLGVVGYMYSKPSATVNQALDNSQTVGIQNTGPDQNTNSAPATASPLNEKDILTATYTISANFGGTKTVPQSVIFPAHTGSNTNLTGTVWIDQNGKLTTSTPASASEAFWIYKYEFTDSTKTQVKVYVGGNFGASGQDNRVYTVKKIGDKIVAEESI